MKALRIIITLFLLFVSLTGFSQDIQYSKELKEQAEAGDAVSQFYMGCVLQDGIGIDADITEAVKWYKKAAEQEQPQAQYNLGLLYLNGTGVEEDSEEFERLNSLAAINGCAEAQCLKGLLYFRGLIYEADLKEAYRWFEVSAQNDYFVAKDFLALFYLTGTVVKQDYQEAIRLYNSIGEEQTDDFETYHKRAAIIDGALNGNAEAQYDMAEIIKAFSSYQNDTDELAKQWYEESAKNNYGPAVLRLALLTDDFSRLIKAAELGNEVAILLVATAYLRGADDDAELNRLLQTVFPYFGSISYFDNYPDEKNFDKSLYWYSKAAEKGVEFAEIRKELMERAKQGDPEAYYLLGTSESSYDEAERNLLSSDYVLESAKKGFIPAMYLLGCDPYNQDAESWLKSASDARYRDADFKLGELYYQNEEYEKAIKELEMSITRSSNSDAPYFLGRCYYSQGTYDSALTWFNTYYKEYGREDRSDIEYLIGQCYFGKKDYKTAIDWYNKRLEGSYSVDSETAYQLGRCYHELHQIPTAIEWYKQAYENGYYDSHNDAAYEIGMFYYSGQGVKKNYTESIKWFGKSRNHKAYYQLGVMHLKGQGVEKDKNEAIRYFEQALRDDNYNVFQPAEQALIELGVDLTYLY